jgi:DNA-binding NarL/FixJ family response regulator
MRELTLETISDHPDIEIVGEVTDKADIARAVEKTQPNFLIVALKKQDRLPAACHEVLQRHPELKVIAIAPDRNSSMFYWASLRVQSNKIEPSEAGLLKALRGLDDSGTRVQ